MHKKRQFFLPTTQKLHFDNFANISPNTEATKLLCISLESLNPQLSSHVKYIFEGRLDP